jgi:hypothetical protein
MHAISLMAVASGSFLRDWVGSLAGTSPVQTALAIPLLVLVTAASFVLGALIQHRVQPTLHTLASVSGTTQPKRVAL